MSRASESPATPAWPPAPGGEDQPRSAVAAPASADLDSRIARVLMAGTYLSIALVGVGVVLMVVNGISPLDPAPPLSVGDLLAALGRVRPEGLLALGLVAIVFTPTARVVASLIGYLQDGERRMALIAAGILGVIALSVVLALGLEG